MNVGDRYRNTYRIQAAIYSLGHIICYRPAPTQYAGPVPVLYDIFYRLFLISAHCRNARFYLVDARFIKKFGDLALLFVRKDHSRGLLSVPQSSIYDFRSEEHTSEL